MFAFDSTTNLPKTGDAANITAYYDLDDGGVTILTDTSATEKDSTNAKGYYIFDLAQAETNGNKILFSAKSSTSNIVVIACPAVVYTRPPNFSATSIDASGRLDIIKIAGTTQTARDIGASVLLSPGTGTGQISLTSGAVTFANTSIGTVTNLTNLPAIPANWLTAAGIAASALDNKGNWNVGKTGYDLVDAPNATAIAAINAAVLSAIGNLNNLSALSNIYGPPLLEIPDSSTADYDFVVVVRDEFGNLVDMDSSPTITATNVAGTDRSANLSVVSHPATGRYTFKYSVASNAAEESLRIEMSGLVSSLDRYSVWQGAVVNYDTITTLLAIKTKTDNLPALPASTTNITAATGVSLTSAYDAAKTAASATNLAAVKTVVDAIQVVTDNLATGWTVSGGVIVFKTATLANAPGGSAPTVADIDAQLSSTHGSGLWGGASGSGSFTITQNVKTSGGANMQGVTVTMYDGSNYYTATTDVDGNATFSLKAATYAQSAYYPGYTITNNGSVVVTANATLTGIVGTAVSIPLPTSPTDCTVAFVAHSAGALYTSKAFTFTMETAPEGSGNAYIGEIRTATSDASTGLVQVALSRGGTKTCQWLAKDTATGKTFYIQVPDADTYSLGNVSV